MSNIRILAAVAAVAALTLTTASARSCDTRDGVCKSGQAKSQAAPLRLSQFLTPGGSATAKSHRNSLSVAGKPHSRATAKAAARPVMAEAMTHPDPRPDTSVAPAEATEPAPTLRASETDGVAVASADEINELDIAADAVKIVAANEVNEIDLAADVAPVAAQNGIATVQAVATPNQPTADMTWIGRLFAALGGILAVASAARLLIA